MEKELSQLPLSRLREEAKNLGIAKISKLSKRDLIQTIIATQQANEKKYAKLHDPIDNSTDMRGEVTILPEGFGFLKTPKMQSPDEYVYVSASQVQKFKLITGDSIRGKVRAPKDGEKYYAMLFIEEVNGRLSQDIIQHEREIMQLGTEKDLSLYEKSHKGVLETNPDGFGFLRTNNYMPGDNDIYLSPSQIRKYRLRTGDLVQGRIRISGENERYDAMLYVEKVNDHAPETIVNRVDFDKLVPIFPNERITLETTPQIISARMLDLFAPLGKGQRALIVAPPKAGKTILLKQIASAIRLNHPKTHLIILLIDERPEEVTDMQRSIDCDVVFSTFDQKPQNHMKAAEMVLERAKRLVELGEDVTVLVDSITRFARASNLVVAPSGRTLSGGLDPESLYFPKKFFGAARNIENGGSLTIMATALVETGSRMDDMIYEEFKGTGNMEVHLERELAESRIFPAINLLRSGTRREELLLSEKEMAASYTLRKSFSQRGTSQMTDNIIQLMKKLRTNREFVDHILKNAPQNEKNV